MTPRSWGEWGGLSTSPRSLVLPPQTGVQCFWGRAEGAAGANEDVIKPGGVITLSGAGWARRACRGPAGGEVKRGQRQGDTPKLGRAMGEALGWVPGRG